eukprot:scaffold57771_cov41-Prasinocladus_malaysianus.AAC.2
MLCALITADTNVAVDIKVADLLDGAADAGDRPDRRPFELGHLELAVEHAPNKRCVSIDLQGCTLKTQSACHAHEKTGMREHCNGHRQVRQIVEIKLDEIRCGEIK